jgi:hypothetical protein
MQAGENIISRIIDLDARAESIRALAREEAEKIKKDAVLDAEKQRKSMELQTAERVRKLSAESAIKRSLEVDKVKKEYYVQVEAIGTISSEKKDRAAHIILSQIRGLSE